MSCHVQLFIVIMIIISFVSYFSAQIQDKHLEQYFTDSWDVGQNFIIIFFSKS